MPNLFKRYKGNYKEYPTEDSNQQPFDSESIVHSTTPRDRAGKTRSFTLFIPYKYLTESIAIQQ